MHGSRSNVATLRDEDHISRPCYRVYDVPTAVEGKSFSPGVWYHGMESNRGDAVPINHRVCDPLRVAAETRSSEDNSVGLLLQFDHRGKPREWVMPKSLLAGRGDRVLEELLLRGLHVEYDQRKHVPRYIASLQMIGHVVGATERTGWHGGRLDTFVLPDHTMGEMDVRFISDTEVGDDDRIDSLSPFATSGSLKGWQREAAALCTKNPVLMLAVGTALAGPLLRILSLNGGGFHLVGDSSTGKTLALSLAASCWGKPEVFSGSWGVTLAGLEVEAYSRNDTVIVLDEVKRADPGKLQELVYTLANGTGKTTATRQRKGRPRRSWRLLGLSSGERSIGDHVSSAAGSAHAGAELRMVDVNAGTRPFRAFDFCHGLDGRSFHRKLTLAIESHYGHLGPAFVQRIIDQDKSSLIQERFREIRDSFHSQHAQADRVADRFAAVATALEQSIEWDLVAWPPGSGLDACHTLFHEWLQSQGTGSNENRQILEGVANFISLHSDSRFSSHADECVQSHIRNRAGYLEINFDQVLHLFNGKALEEAAPGYGRRRVLGALSDAGAIAKTDPGRLTKKYRVPGGRAENLYAIDSEKVHDFLLTNTPGATQHD